MPTKSPPSLRERRRREVIREVERVALDQFIEHGFENVSVSTICELAGISPSTFFRHFPGKDAIIAGVVRTTVEQTGERLSELPLSLGLVEGYLQAFEERVRDVDWAGDGTLYHYTRVMVSRPFRAAFMDDVTSGDHRAMDAEIARRLGLDADDPAVRMIRATQWAAVDLAIHSLHPGDGIAEFLAHVRANLSLLATMEQTLRAREATS
jgi:AcrR family transcriptional regulator